MVTIAISVVKFIKLERFWAENQLQSNENFENWINDLKIDVNNKKYPSKFISFNEKK